MTNKHPITSPPEPTVDDILLLAAIIREVDGGNRLGAAQLAEDILSHPASRWGRPTPQPEPEGMTDEGLEVVASQFCSFHHAHMSSADEWRCSRSGLTTFARAVLARWGRPTPQPPADGEVADGEVADLVAALKVIDKMQHEWILLGNDDGTASPSLTMPISLRRFTVIRDALTRAAELLQCQQPQPVPVSERPPLSHECDEDGHLWLGVLETDALLGCPHFSLWSYDESRKRLGGSYTHFLPYNTPLLPAHALPLPTSEEVEA